MKDLKQILLNQCYGQNLEQRKRWYSPAAEAYNQVRPQYPQPLIDRVIKIAQLSSHSNLLEVGCGPATATSPFAKLGCNIVCLEPNPDFYRLAQQNCESFPNVKIQNTSFEEWELQPSRFDAVLAASSFHWIPPEIGYPKASKALHQDGVLILLWNKELQPSYEVYRHLSEVYKIHAPSLIRDYEDHTEQVALLDSLGQMAIESGQFKDMVSGQMESEVTYFVEQYLLLLTTYSNHLKLEPQQKDRLFTALRKKLEQKGDTIQLSYVSAFHIARPK
jgi:SAM-dependent methyltransferase